MRIHLVKYIGLGVGIFSVLISYLFFGRLQEVYQLLSLGGMIVAGLFYLIILLRKGSARAKLLTTGILFLCVGMLWIVQPVLIKTSYHIYRYSHSRELAEINSILRSKTGQLTITHTEVRGDTTQLTNTEKAKLLALQKKVGAYMILKSEHTISYELWGFLDVRLGLTYHLDGRMPLGSHRATHLTGNWYY